MEIIFVNVPSKINNDIIESERSKLLAALYRNYFNKPILTEEELRQAKKVLQEYIEETKYKPNH